VFNVRQVREGAYDYKVNETVSVVTAKTTEIGQRTWGIVRGVMALATYKLEEYAGDTSVTQMSYNSDLTKNKKKEYHQEFSHELRGRNNTSQNGQSSFVQQDKLAKSSTWNDWDNKDDKSKDTFKQGSTHNSDGWAGWDDTKDNGFDDFHQNPTSNKSSIHDGNSDGTWGEGGFL